MEDAIKHATFTREDDNKENKTEQTLGAVPQAAIDSVMKSKTPVGNVPFGEWKTVSEEYTFLTRVTYHKFY